jgi:hypothetical protein
MQTQFVLDHVPNVGLIKALFGLNRQINFETLKLLKCLQKEIEIWGLVCEKSDNKQTTKQTKKPINERNIFQEENSRSTSPTHVGISLAKIIP